MNGVHDVGGMHGFGPIRREEAASPFHEPWEGRVYAMMSALLRMAFTEKGPPAGAAPGNLRRGLHQPDNLYGGP